MYDTTVGYFYIFRICGGKHRFPLTAPLLERDTEWTENVLLSSTMTAGGAPLLSTPWLPNGYHIG